MAEITLFSNKNRKETSRYIFVILFAFISWLLQVSIFSNFLFFDAIPNLMLLGAIFFGIVSGPLIGTLYGIICSFLSASILYDHVFYFSFPLIGLFAGLLVKNMFSDELLFFILLSFLLTLVFECLNGWQYSVVNQANFFNRYFLAGFSGAVLNLLFAPFYYWLMGFVTKKLKLR